MAKISKKEGLFDFYLTSRMGSIRLTRKLSTVSNGASMKIDLEHAID